MNQTEERFAFQAETRQVLDLVINSLYTHKEIFLRELISNASDALDRRRFEALTRPELLGTDETLAIRLTGDRAARTLSVSDNGIGMSRDELVANIGTIAKSGTRELVREAGQTQRSDMLAELIGRFGVGFYSAFMVADRVEIVTRRAGDQQATRWESAGDGEFIVAPAQRDQAGTTITLHLKSVDEEAGLLDFTEAGVLRRIVKRYSDFVTYPILLAPSGGQPAEGAGDETLNSMKPIWTRPAAEVSEEEMKEFYRHISHDWGEPARWLQFRAEGRVEYQALLFVPSRAPLPFELAAGRFGLQLYSRRVLIMERCETLLPPYLRFLKGVVDSADLPLNVSREMLQHDRHMVQIRRWLTRKVLDSLARMAEHEPAVYADIWRNFGAILKEGVAGDPDNRDRVIDLLRFPSSHDEAALTSLAGYVERMGEEQDAVYYLAGESRHVLEHSPHAESLRGRGWEVLYLLDPVDELVVEWVEQYRDKPLRSATVAAPSSPETPATRADEEPAQERSGGALTGLCTWLKDRLGEAVAEVTVSRRLTSSPACLTAQEHQPSPQLDRVLRAMGQTTSSRPKVLEVNPDHPLILGLQRRLEREPGDPILADQAELLLGYALLAEGSELPDPVRFTRLLADTMAHAVAAPPRDGEVRPGNGAETLPTED